MKKLVHIAAVDAWKGQGVKRRILEANIILPGPHRPGKRAALSKREQVELSSAAP